MNIELPRHCNESLSNSQAERCLKPFETNLECVPPGFPLNRKGRASTRQISGTLWALRLCTRSVPCMGRSSRRSPPQFSLPSGPQSDVTSSEASLFTPPKTLWLLSSAPFLCFHFWRALSATGQQSCRGWVVCVRGVCFPCWSVNPRKACTLPSVFSGVCPGPRRGVPGTQSALHEHYLK